MIRSAVVGVGYLGRFHAQKHKMIPGVELVAVCDRDPEQGQKVAQELNVEFVSDFRQLLGRVDAVTVAASTPAHFELTQFFLQNHIHVNVEKPITVSSREGEVLCRLADEKNLVLQVGHVERFNPALVSAQEKLNRPLFIECHRLAPFKPRSVEVDVVLDLMIHDLDVILSLVKSEVVSVSAIGTPVLTKKVDIANARLEFVSGTVANVTASRVSLNSQRKFRVFQQDQYLSVDFGQGEVSLLTKTGEWPEAEVLSAEADIPLERESWNLEKGDALLAETQSFFDSIAKGQRPVVSGWDGLVALRLAEQIIDSIEQRLRP